MLVSHYYNGFYIEKPVGNNAFSYAQRKNKKIYVPPLCEGTFGDLKEGQDVVFSEIEQGKEINARGLAQFLHLQSDQKDIFIFDNHNHAFFFWCWGVKMGKINLGEILVHIDQHKDMRKPEKSLTIPRWSSVELKEVFEYTNFELNVGNFIPPALDIGIFSQVEIWDNQEAFSREFPEQFVLDLDVDIFAPTMTNIDEDKKFSKIRQGLAQARFITIATSPFFMNQGQAIKLIKDLLAQ